MFNVLKWEMLELVENPDSRVVGNLWQTHLMITLPMSDHLVGSDSYRQNPYTGSVMVITVPTHQISYLFWQLVNE